MRLNKYIANSGICSRRNADELIASGKVFVNEKKVLEMGMQIHPGTDIVVVNGKTLKGDISLNTHVYIMLNKPIDYVSSTSSKQGISVLELISVENAVKSKDKELAEKILPDIRLYPVGRLDKDSEGLVLLTNDGAFAHYMMHPRHQHPKEYEVLLDQMISSDAKKVLEGGMHIDGEMFQGMQIKKTFQKGKRYMAVVVLREGKNRQIRRMFGRLGFRILELKRIRIAKLNLTGLPVGKWCFVKKSDIL